MFAGIIINVSNELNSILIPIRVENCFSSYLNIVIIPHNFIPIAQYTLFDAAFTPRC